jgi:putative flippase GtrA
MARRPGGGLVRFPRHFSLGEERLKEFVNQFLLFSAVGAVGTAAHFAVLIFLVQLKAVDPVSASMAGFTTGALINYGLNYYYTFRSGSPHHASLPKFLAVALAGLCLNTMIMTLLTEWLHYLLSQALTTMSVLVWNYLCNRYWTFRESLLRGAR